MSSPSSADGIIARCRRVYAECGTYADEGEQRTTYTMLDGAAPPYTKLLRFQTWWRRPDRFRFEFRTAHFGEVLDELYVIWTAPDATRSWWTVQPTLRTTSSLSDALQAAAGVSGLTSCFVPDLLRADPEQRTLPALGGFVGTEVEQDGRRCLAITMRFAGLGEPPPTRRVWIDIDSELLLRVDEVSVHTTEAHASRLQREIHELEATPDVPGLTADERLRLLDTFREDMAEDFHEFRMESTTVYRPRLDVPIDDAELEFAPPEEVA